jgi:hypothetical protein
MGRPSNRSKRQSEAMRRYWKRRKATEASTGRPASRSARKEPPKRVAKAIETLRAYFLSA